MATQKNITVTKTARYYVLGNPSDTIEQIWFVCHGYGELAKYFIRNFDVLENEKTMVVAPEALNRFYRQGFSGKVGGTWMTSEDRENEIHDYLNYLNAVYDEVIASVKNKNVKIIILGFSQGATTVCRWAATHKTNVNHLILWSGNFAHDINFEKERDFFNSINIKFAMGLEDEYYTEAEINELRNFIHNKGINAQFIPFKGKHAIHKETLVEIANSI